jgi:hypothetical protein
MNWSKGEFSWANPFDSDPWYQNALEIGGCNGAATDVYAGFEFASTQIDKFRTPDAS